VVNLEGMSLLPLHRAHIPAIRWDMARERALVRNVDKALQS
jgi:hypothetical protein